MLRIYAKTQHRIGGRGLVGWLLVFAVLATACKADPGASGAVDPPVVAAAPAGAVTDAQLTAAGLQIVADETVKTVPAPGRLMITRIQADRMIAEQAAGGGLRGTEVDGLAPMPEGSPPMSYLVAAWVKSQPTASSKVAHKLMGERDWRHAQQVTYPLVVLSMFITDITQSLKPAPTRSTPPSRSGLRPPVAAVVDPCGDISAFLAKALKTVFDALKLKPVKAGGIFFFVPWLAQVWNIALGLAQGVVQAVVDKLTKPLFDTLRAAIGALTVATLVVSYFTKQTLTVKTAAPGPYRFSVGAEAPLSGEFVATADPLTSKWPDALVKCAAATNKKLPEVLNEGARATWTLQLSGPVINAAPLNGRVGKDRTARLPFTTGHEADDQGTPVTGQATARVEVERKEIADLLSEAKQQVRNVLTSLLSALPIPASVLNGIFDPMLNVIEAQLNQGIGGVFGVSGSGTVSVVFHQPKPTPTPTPTPTKSPGPGDFCTQYRAMAKWSHDHLASPTVEAWAGELVRRLTVMRPLAPAAKLTWVDSMLRVYRLVATSAGAARIGNEVAASNFPAAGTGLASYCKVDPALLQPR